MKKSLYVVVIAVLLLLPQNSFSLPLIDLEVAVGGWLNSPSGDAGYRGDSLDIENDLGFEDETDLQARLRLELPFFFPNVNFMTTNLEYDATHQTTKGFDFGDTDFLANKDFYSKVVLDHNDLAVSFSLPLLKLASFGTLAADLGLNLRLVDIEATIEQDGLKESKDLTLPIPMGFAYLRLEPIEGIAFETEYRGLVLGDNSMTSLIGRARYNFFGPAFMAGGYRLEKIDIDEEGIRIETDFKGPFFEVGFKF